MKHSFAPAQKRLFLHLFVALWLTAVLLTSGFARGSSQASPPPSAAEADVTVTLENVGSTAWTVVAVEGADGVTEIGPENPVVRLKVGQRYRFVNTGSLTVHPLAIRGADGEPVLGQRPNHRPFEHDPEVAFKADDEGMTFTLTAALAAVVRTYYCTAHPTPLMEGALEVRSAP